MRILKAFPEDFVYRLHADIVKMISLAQTIAADPNNRNDQWFAPNRHYPKTPPILEPAIRNYIPGVRVEDFTN
jgi:hypothetical protein